MSDCNEDIRRAREAREKRRRIPLIVSEESVWQRHLGCLVCCMDIYFYLSWLLWQVSAQPWQRDLVVVVAVVEANAKACRCHHATGLVKAVAFLMQTGAN